MPNEKFPKDYDQSTIQKIIEGVRTSVSQVSKKAAQELADTSQEIKDSINKLARKVQNLAEEGEGEQGKAPSYVPPPLNLTVYEFGTWGFAHVDPFLRWKYKGKIVGYEFYGSMNVDTSGDFEIHEQEYIQRGIHYGYTLVGEGAGTNANPNNYLYTQGPTDAESHILDRRLVNPIASKRLILENLTQKTEKTIGGTGALPVLAYNILNPKYKLRAGNIGDSLTWVDGDEWRIRDYPSNLLFSIGALAIFYKRAGNFYVKARTVGKGHSYSEFTSVVSSTGVTSTEDVPAPNIVMPVHYCGGTVYTSCTLDVAYDYRPYCPWCDRVVDWSEIVSGTRETDHFSFFGFEACNVEFVYEELDSSLGDFFYQTKRGIAEDDTAEIEYKEGDVT